jgi:serine/threonine-protein kinase
MGVVVAARHLTLEDRVAIKFLLPACLKEPEYVQRFLREARAAVRIRSQHVARVSDVGTMENGAPYMILEYLEGRTLAAVLGARGALPYAFAIELVLQACEALAEAHALGIVHRDVKPGNLFLTHHADGSPCVKVLDFGVSKVGGGQEHALTRTGIVLGSPFYMSPEHLSSARDVDARADVYSIGVVLYELLAGRAPFMGGDLPQLVYSIMNEPPQPLRALRPEIPEGVEVAVLRAMARDRDARFFSVADLAVALAPFAPAAARGSVDRICGILRNRDPRLARALADDRATGAQGARWLGSGTLTAPMGPSPPAASAGSPTITALGGTQPPPARARWRGAMLAGLGVAAIAVGSFAWRSSDHATSAAAGSMTSAVHPAPLATPLPRVEEAPPPTATAFAVIAAPDAGPPSTTSSVPPRRNPTLSVPPPAAPKSGPPKSDPFKRDVF